MTYPFVQAFHDLGPRRGPVLGFLIHMAEGGGTVGFLGKANRRGVSVHYVIEYSGRTVQMLLESHMHSSLRTDVIRTSDDPDGLYGATAARAALGSWATIATTLGPNHATIAVELEGKEADGPNSDQAAALVRLGDDVRSRHPDARNLGHRDFTTDKACPGHHIDWAALGGHGPAAEDPMAIIKVGSHGPFTVTVGPGDQIYDEAFRPFRVATVTKDFGGLFYTSTGYIAVDNGGRLAFVKSADVVVTNPPSTAVLEAKIAAARAALA